METGKCDTDIGNVENWNIVEAVTNRHKPVETLFQFKASNVFAHDRIQTGDLAVGIRYRCRRVEFALEAFDQRLNPEIQIAGDDKAALRVFVDEGLNVGIELDLRDDGSDTIKPALRKIAKRRRNESSEGDCASHRQFRQKPHFSL